MPYKLFDYQIEYGINYLRRVNGRGALWWDMRLRKTLPVIRFFSQRKDARRKLIFGPYSVLPEWEEQLRNDDIKNIFPIYKVKTGKERTEFLKQLHNENSIGWFLVNCESPVHINIFCYGWDLIAADESTFLANPKAQITKQFLMNAKSKYFVALSGTPRSESELQYFVPLHIINREILGYSNFWEYRAARFQVIGHDFCMPVRHKLWLASRLNKFCSVLKREDVGMKKERVEISRYFELPSDARELYDRIEQDAMLWGDILKFAGQRWNMLRRICGGFNDSGTVIHWEKMRLLTGLLDGEFKGKRLVIWAWYKSEVEKIAAWLKCPFIHGEIDSMKRNDIRLRFNNGKYQYLVAEPACWRFGTSLKNVDAVIFYSRPLSNLTNTQVSARTEDLGTEDATLLVDLICKDSVEEDIIASLKAKESKEQLMERIRRGVQLRRNKIKV